ncbi:hypothetical protein ACET3Z_000977 [Daucus carota]
MSYRHLSTVQGLKKKVLKAFHGYNQEYECEGKYKDIEDKVSFIAFLEQNLISVPEELCKHLVMNRCNTFVFMVDGNAGFHVKLDSESKKFVLAEEDIKRLGILTFLPMLLELVGSNIFKLTLFNAEGLDNVLGSREIQKSKKLTDSEVTEETNSTENIELAKFMFNAYTYEHHPLCFEISNCSIRRLLDFQFGNHTISDFIISSVGAGKVWFIFANKTFEMDFEIRDSNLCFVKGWGNFIKKNCLHEGDVLVLQPIDNSHMFRTCTMRRDAFTVFTDEMANESQDQSISMFKFVSVVNYCSLHTGKVGIPLLLLRRLRNKFPKKTECCLGTGQMVNISFSPKKGGFLGMRGFFVLNKIKVDDILVVEYNGDSKIRVRCFRRGVIEIILKGPDRISTSNLVKESQKNEHLLTNDNIVSGSQVQLLQNPTQEEDAINLPELQIWLVKIQPSHLDDHCHGVVSISS